MAQEIGLRHLAAAALCESEILDARLIPEQRGRRILGDAVCCGDGPDLRGDLRRRSLRPGIHRFTQLSGRLPDEISHYQCGCPQKRSQHATHSSAGVRASALFISGGGFVELLRHIKTYERALRTERRPVSQTAAPKATTQNIAVTARHVVTLGKPACAVLPPAAAACSACANRIRCSPTTPYVSGLIHITQASQPDSGTGKNAPDKSHIGISSTLMRA